MVTIPITTAITVFIPADIPIFLAGISTGAVFWDSVGARGVSSAGLNFCVEAIVGFTTDVGAGECGASFARARMGAGFN